MTAALCDSPMPDETGIAELASESIVVLDPQGVVGYWNPAAEQLFGWPALAVRGTDLTRLSPVPDEEATAEAMAAVDAAKAKADARTESLAVLHKGIL